MPEYKDKQIPDWLKNMPKSDLHCHIGGSMRLETLLDLADKYSVKLPADNPKDLKKKIVHKYNPDKTLSAYLKAISLCESVLVKPEAFERVAYEICEDAHKEGVNIFELRFGPTNYVNEKLRLYEVVEATLSGLKQAKTDFEMQNGLIIIGIRHDTEQKIKSAAEIAVNYQQHGVVGFDIAGKENGYRPRQFREFIDPVYLNLLPVTIHAGEEDTAESILEAVSFLNAKRIGHGIALQQNTKLRDHVNRFRYSIEICPTSNVDTGSVASIDSHPVRAYHFEDGLRMSINTDNRTISDTTVTNEFMVLHDKLGFSKQEIYKLARHGIKSAFLDLKIRDNLLNKFDEYASKN